MSMTIIATVVARPDAVQTVAAALQAMVEPTLGEPGCLVYDLFASTDAAGTFYLVESYVDAAALAAHQASPHFLALVASVGDKLARDIRIEKIERL